MSSTAGTTGRCCSAGRRTTSTSWAGRRYGGQTLRGLGVWAGGLDYTAVTNAIVRLESCAKTDRPLGRAMVHLRRQCGFD